MADVNGSVLIVIPARYASTRFPGKPLAPVAGEPLVVHALRTATTAACRATVVVATDDRRIAEVVRAAGGGVVMTDPDLASGSDRVWAAAAELDGDYVVNLQVDEPLLPGSVIDALVDRLATDIRCDISTPVVATSRAAASPDDVVTVARAEDGTALYFSRAVIPWDGDPVWRHIGVYAYRREALARFVGAAPAALELVERLEQLRALSLGLRIAAVELSMVSHAVDRPEDVAVVEDILVRALSSHGELPS